MCNNQVFNILNHLYENSSIYLERKYQKYLEIKDLYFNKMEAKIEKTMACNQ
jgi:hypothetical protein